jgi:aspartate aminotransferase
MGTVDQGDEIIIPEPFYANYNGFQLHLVTVVPIISSIDWVLPTSIAISKINYCKNKAILICNPD